MPIPAPFKRDVITTTAPVGPRREWSYVLAGELLHMRGPLLVAEVGELKSAEDLGDTVALTSPGVQVVLRKSQVVHVFAPGRQDHDHQARFTG